MSNGIILSGVCFFPEDFTNYGWLNSVTVNGTSYIRILALFAAGISAMQASGNSFAWTFATSTTMADPGTGSLRLNNATIASATQMAISCLTADTGNPNIRTYLATWDDSTNTVRGYITIRKSGTPSTYAIFSINSALTDNTTWDQIPLTYVGGNGTFSASDSLYIQFSRAGDTGSITGGTLTGTLTAGAQLITGGIFKGSKGFINALGSVSGSQALDFTAGNIVTATQNANTLTFTYSNIPASGTYGYIYHIVTLDSTPHSVTFTGVTWDSITGAPSLIASKELHVVLEWIDGATPRGTLIGQFS